jgi:YD repeat-containing protein
LLSKKTLNFNNVITTDETYNYDDKNRVIELKESSGNDYKYTYDNNNNLTIAKTYDSNNTLTSTANYTYSGNTVSVISFYGDGTVSSTYTFTVDANQKVTSTTLGGSNIFTYDSNGNITHYDLSGPLTQSDSYSYDSKKHPLSMIGARNLQMMFLLGEPQTFVNNVVQEQARPENFSYVYNNDGFPTSATETGNTSQSTTITYEYIIK